MGYTRLNNLLGWLSFAIAMAVYGSTVEPTASFWDCGEYIATSYKMEVGHPPGAPLFMMIGRAVSMFVNPDQVALMVNLLSAFSSALTIMFLFWTVTMLAKKMVVGSSSAGPGERTLGLHQINESLTLAQKIAIFGSGFIGAMAYTFSDTFWFSAVEGEVYAMSSLFTAIVFWAILKWEQVADEPGANRWLVLIAYLVGLSIGIHLLNLLAIPAIGYVYYFRKYKTDIVGIIITGVVSVLLLGIVQNVVIPGIVTLAYYFELFFVNKVKMPLNSGSFIFIGGLLTFLLAGIAFSQMKKWGLVNLIFMSFTVLLIGYSSFAMILVRSSANTPIDENNPENMINLLAYLNRDQYGEWPLMYGQYFNSPLDINEPYLDGDPLYYQDKVNGKYFITDHRKGTIPNYDKRFKAVFPRMWSSKSNHIRAYKRWSKFKGKAKRATNVQTGESMFVNKPTFVENMRFFIRYQIQWMYGRYFLWNFAGRQNDVQGHGSVKDGNWISGLTFIDAWRLGPQKNLPDELANNKARNKFYFLPLILGLIGLFFHFGKDWRYGSVVALLFLFTGLAIVVYLNQYPYQPRERDYAYAGSFYAFAIWIGLGVFAIYDTLPKMGKELNTVVASVITFFCLAVPGIMAAEGWDDHDRSGRYTARDIAKNYLESCEPNAILFTNGDNDTFPLWYIQEVEGFRTDVRVVNLTLLSTDWFINQMKRKAYDGLPIPSSMTEKIYRQGTRDYMPITPIGDNKTHIDIRELVPFVTNDENRRQFTGGKPLNFFPTNKFKLGIDSAKVVSNGTVPLQLADKVVDEMVWEVNNRFIMKSELVLMDILAQNNWERPIYFANTMPRNSYFGLEEYMQHEGFAYRLVPIKYGNQPNGFGYYGGVDVDKMYQNLMVDFKFGGLENLDIYLDENNLRFVTNLRLNFIRLAQELHRQGDLKRCKEVLDKCLKYASNANTPTDVTFLNLAELYFKCGEQEQALALVNRMTNHYEETFWYFLQMADTEMQREIEADLKQSLGVYQRCVQMTTEQFPQTDEISLDYTSRLDSMVRGFNQAIPINPQNQQLVPR